MGKRWRVFVEGVLQKWRIPFVNKRAMDARGGFIPTVNERNKKMLDEATRVAQYVKAVEQHLTKVSKEVKGLSSKVNDLMRSEVPKQYTMDATGSAVPVEQESRAMGSGVNIEQITTAAQMLDLRMKEDVHNPLSEWLSAYERAKGLMRRVESLRLELDSRRRTVMSLSQKAKLKKYQLDKATPPPPQSFDVPEPSPRQESIMLQKDKALQETRSKLDHKNNKKDATDAEFKESEAECMQAMCALLNDASHLSDFIGQSYKILYETSLEAYQGFGPAEPMQSVPYPLQHSPEPRPQTEVPSMHHPSAGIPQAVPEGGGAWNPTRMAGL